jgi:ATP-dependent protease ClpP protease subunit
MPKELLIYGQIYSQSTVDFINGMNEIEADEDLSVRISSEGGDVLYGFGMIAKFNEHKGKKVVKVDGKAYSMGLFFCAYTENVEALDTSKFLLHRAAYSEWFEESQYFTDEMRAQLIEVNKQLMDAFKAKVDVAKFEELKGVKLKDIFSMESRIDVYLNAQEAKQIGLINKIVKITPQKMSAINSEMNRIAASFTGAENINEIVPMEATISESETKNNKKMTVEEFKKAHPEAVKAMNDEAVKTEQDRVNAWLKFNDVDATAVAEGIASGENISQTAMADFSKKMFASQALEKIGAEAAPIVETTEEVPGATAQKTELEVFEARIAGNLGLNSENK